MRWNHFSPAPANLLSAAASGHPRRAKACAPGDGQSHKCRGWSSSRHRFSALRLGLGIGQSAAERFTDQGAIRLASLPPSVQVCSNWECRSPLRSPSYCSCPASRLPRLAPLPPDLACRWSAQLTAARPECQRRYVVPFDLDIERTAHGSSSRAAATAATASIFPPPCSTGNELILRLDQYDAALSAHCSPSRPATRWKGSMCASEARRSRAMPSVPTAGAAGCANARIAGFSAAALFPCRRLAVRLHGFRRQA